MLSPYLNSPDRFNKLLIFNPDYFLFLIFHLTVLISHKYLETIIIDFFTVIPAKLVPGLNRKPESRWIQEVSSPGCRIKSGMTENFGLSSF
jgi:hypothetical protein